MNAEGLAPKSAVDPLRPLQMALSALGLVFVLASFLPLHGFDLYAYWTVDPAEPYLRTSTAVNSVGSFFYAPPLALVMAPLGGVPWGVAIIAWLGIQLAALWFIGRGWALALVVFPPVWLDIVYGNVNVLLAAMIVAGFRSPATWSFALLTKVTPGVGVIWFAVRSEWRALAHLTAAIAAIAATSIVVQGVDSWSEWIAILAGADAAAIPPDALAIPILPRLAVAAAIVAWGARTNRRWLVPIGVTLAMPLLWPIAFAPLVACWALVPPETAARIRRAIAGWTIRGSASTVPNTGRMTGSPQSQTGRPRRPARRRD